MNIESTKLELMHLLLQTQKESLLNKLKKVFEEESKNSSLSEKKYQMIDKRREDYLIGEGESLSWQEVKEKAIKEL